MIDNPIFITGVYRSGTTLPVKILDSNSQLSLTHDSVNFFRYYAHRPELTYNYTALVEDASQRILQRFGIHSPVNNIINELSGIANVQFKDIYHVFMKHTFAGGNEDIRWGEKSLLQWNNIPLFLSMYPAGQVIHLIRDPRDVLTSFRAFTHEPGNRYLDVIFACLGSFKWIMDNKHLFSSDRYIFTRYEDLVDDPEKWARNICNFLSVPFEKQMLDISNFKGHDKQPWKGNSSYSNEQLQISKSAINRWKDKLSKPELLLVDTILSEYIKEFGYDETSCSYSLGDIKEMWNMVKSSPLITSRFEHWMNTGEGTDKYPSDPTNPSNWAENNTKN